MAPPICTKTFKLNNGTRLIAMKHDMHLMSSNALTNLLQASNSPPWVWEHGKVGRALIPNASH